MSKRPHPTSVKTSLEIKEFVNNTDYSYGDLLEVGYNTITKNNDKEMLFKYEKRLKELKTEKALIEIEEEGLIQKIQEIKAQKDKKNSNETYIDENTLKCIDNTIEKIKQRFDSKNNTINFNEINDAMFMSDAKKCNIEIKEFKKLVIEYYNKS